MARVTIDDFFCKGCGLCTDVCPVGILELDPDVITAKGLERKIPRITFDTRGHAAVIGIDYADVRDFASAGVLTKTDDGEWIWRQHTWICADSPFIDSIKFPLRNNNTYS